MLEYKGYSGHVEFDSQAGVFHGEVLGTRDVITFQGTSVAALETAFRDSVDDYLEFCAQRNEEPDKAFSGKLMLRITPGQHRRAYLAARQEGKSLNQWISDWLGKAG